MFGCSCYPLLRPYNKHKLECHSKEYVHFGKNAFHKGYVCLDKDTGKTFVYKQVIFDKSSFPIQQITIVSIGSSVPSLVLLLSNVMSLPMSLLVSHSRVSKDSTTPTIVPPSTLFTSQSHSSISPTFS